MPFVSAVPVANCCARVAWVGPGYEALLILCDCLIFRTFQCPAGSTWAAAFRTWAVRMESPSWARARAFTAS